jgi:hypothetical protein
MKKSRLLGVLYACALSLSSTLTNAALVTDVMGDAVIGSYATYDITSIDALFTATDITFNVNLTSNPLAPSVVGNSGINGFIDIDIDMNPFSGASSNISSLSFPFGNSGLGVEYYIDLFSESSHAGFVAIKHPILLTTTMAPIIYGTNMFSVTVPLSQLNNDDGMVNYAVVVGDFGNVTDQAVDAGIISAGGMPASSSLAPVPVPAAVWLFFSGLLGLIGIARRKKPKKLEKMA